MNKKNITIYKTNPEADSMPLPYVDEGIKAGFPSPAQDYIDQVIDLSEELVRNPSSTFFARVNGDSMIGERLYDGDIMIIDKSLTPRDNDKVVCYIDGEFTVKLVEIDKPNNLIWLVSANPDYPKIKVTPDNEFLIWGVVTYTINKQRT